MKGLSIDKRILIFALFALPLILVAFISYITNTQTLYQGSKADEVKNEKTVTPTPSLPKQITCLVPQAKQAARTVSLLAEKGSTFIPSLPLQILAVQPVSIQYLSLVEMIPTGNAPVTTVDTNIVERGGLVRFVAIQGDITGFSEPGSDLEVRIQSIARSCQALVLP